MANQRNPNFVELDNWNLAGLSSSKWSGVKHSLYRMVGVDPHTQPGVLGAAQKLTKNSGETVTEFCKARLSSSNGRTYWGSSASGKIWERTAAGAWSLVHTIVASAGEVKILELFEYRGYIYIATESRLHRILASDALGASEWTANKALNWATFTITDKLFHPMIEHNLVLYIGDGNYLAQVDTATFTADALDIKTPLRIKSLGKIGFDILLGTWVADTITKTEIIRWNTYSVSFTTSDEIPETGINAFLPADNFVLVQAGLEGNIYFYNGEKLELYNKIPGVYTPTAYGYVHPNAVANLGGQILFGFSNGSGDPALEGVYRIARHSRNYDYITDLPYPISQRSGDDLVLTGLEIGAVLAVGQNLLVSWKHGSSYGVDMVDWSNKLDGAYIESRVHTMKRDEFANISEFVAAYAELPTDTVIQMSYDKNYTGSYTDVTQVIDIDRKIISADSEGLAVTTVQLKVTLTTKDNTTPLLESATLTVR